MAKKDGNWFIEFLNLLLGVFTAMIGYHIHGSIFWTIVDFLCWPLVWTYWLFTNSVSLSIIKDTFSFFLN